MIDNRVGAVLGGRLLDELEAAGVPYAVLHGESRLARGILHSDVDLAVGRSIADVIAILRRAARDAGAELVMVNPYDHGGLATYWVRRDWSGGVQIDLLRDPNARSKLAFKTDVALRHVRRGDRWPTLEPAAERAYLLSKRWLKGDVEALSDLLEQQDGSADQPLLEILTPRRARAVYKFRATTRRQPPRMRTWPLVRSRISARGLRRIRYPVGVLIGLIGDDAGAPDLAEAICTALGNVPINAERVYGRSLITRFRRFWSLRRPQALIAVGNLDERPDIEIKVTAETETTGMLDLILTEMAALTEVRVERHLAAHHLDS